MSKIGSNVLKQKRVKERFTLPKSGAKVTVHETIFDPITQSQVLVKNHLDEYFFFTNKENVRHLGDDHGLTAIHDHPQLKEAGSANQMFLTQIHRMIHRRKLK